MIGADGTTVTSISSDVLMQADRLYFDATGSFSTAVNTSGDIVLESVADSFVSALNITNRAVFGNPASLRVGKSTNTADITVLSN